MNKRYEVHINYERKAWCQIIIEHAWSRDVISDLQLRFPASQGFELQIFESHETRRLLESGDQGLATLAVEYQLSPLNQ